MVKFSLVFLGSNTKSFCSKRLEAKIKKLEARSARKYFGLAGSSPKKRLDSPLKKLNVFTYIYLCTMCAYISRIVITYIQDIEKAQRWLYIVAGIMHSFD